jgi:exoribonuclease-2
MLLAGEAAARFAIEQRLPFPFVVQEGLSLPPDADRTLQEWASRPPNQLSMAQRFALRRFMKRSQASVQPGPHGGVGLPVYSRVTSPLRRYLDLTAHHQLRLHLAGRPPLHPGQMLERVAFSESVTGSVAQTESLSRRHWTLVYLMQHPDWRSQAVLVEKSNNRGHIIIPALAFEGVIPLRHDLPLDTLLTVKAGTINLPDLEAQFILLDV